MAATQIVYSMYVKLPGQALDAHAGTFTTLSRANAALEASVWPAGSIVSVRSHELDAREPDWCLVARKVF